MNVLMDAPSIDYINMQPILVVLGAAVIAVLIEAFVDRAYRRNVQLVLT